jgi:hypothetical protein
MLKRNERIDVFPRVPLGAEYIETRRSREGKIGPSEEKRKAPVSTIFHFRLAFPKPPITIFDDPCGGTDVRILILLPHL